MEQSAQPQSQVTTNSTINYKRDIYIREARRLIGEMAHVRAKTSADIGKNISPNRSGRASDSRVWGMTLGGTYNPVRQQACALKKLFVEELGIEDDYGTLEHPFESTSSEELNENSATIDRAMKALEKLIELAYEK